MGPCAAQGCWEQRAAQFPPAYRCLGGTFHTVTPAGRANPALSLEVRTQVWGGIDRPRPTLAEELNLNLARDSLSPPSEHDLSTDPPSLERAAGLTPTSQDEKTLNLNVILQSPQRIHCVGIQKDIPGCERASFLFSAHRPPPSLSGAACLSLTTAACCLWRPGVSGAAPDICRPRARAA